MSSARTEPNIAAKVEFLRRPDSYPDPTRNVELVETHRSWVFLTDRYAYKLKKPVRCATFDFSTLGARRQNCCHEIHLNRRFTEGVYLSIVSLTIDGEQRLTIEGDGEPVEWMVQMRKLDRGRMLDCCISNATVTPQEIKSVGRLLSAFYRQASPSAWSGAHYCRHLLESISGARLGLLRHVSGLPATQTDAVASRLAEFVNVHRAELIQRVRDGRVIDAHGDLRPEHICLESPPVIIDCLEFNQELRILDSASEVMFLAQECELLGAAKISQLLWRDYQERTADHAASKLCRFYGAYHAFLRASIALAHLCDQDVNLPAKWKLKAQRYLDVASIALR